MTDEVNKISSFAEILSIDERTEQINHRKDPTDPNKTLYDTASIGWFCRINESSAIYVGMEKPPAGFCRGARIKVSIELAPYLTGEHVERSTQEPPAGLTVIEKIG